jgi:hypothetical protein
VDEAWIVDQGEGEFKMSKYVDGINEERFDNFLSDLRSGNYKQGKNALHVIERFEDGSVVELQCCLGIACLRPAAEGVITVGEGLGNGSYRNVKYDGYNTVDLPIKVAEYLGIPEVNRIDDGEGSCNVAFFKAGYVKGDSSTYSFTAIGFNDNLDKSFEEIADAFEKEFTRE